MPWVREGACPPERCQGRCCKHIGSWVSRDDESAKFLAALRTRGVDVYEVGDKYLIDVPQTCQYLSEGLCKLHPAMKPPADLPTRPSFCDEWPTDPSQTLLDDCGFSFRWVAAIDAAE